MTTIEYIQEFIDKSSYKIEHSVEEYKAIDSELIKATTFYQIYKANVFGSDDRLTMKEFFHLCGQYFYYDKYICTHGTEFYYHIKFNDAHPMYQLQKSIIDEKIKANAPETLDDVDYVVEAVSKR